MNNFINRKLFTDYLTDLEQKRSFKKINNRYQLNINKKSKFINIVNCPLAKKTLISFIKINLANLFELKINNSNIINLEPFINNCYNNLNILDLQHNKIKYLSPLGKISFTNLEHLILSSNLIVNIAPLSDLNNEKLIKLDFSSKKIKNIYPLNKFKFIGLKK